MTDLPKVAKPAGRALSSLGIEKLQDLTRHTEQEVMSLHGMGPNALRTLKMAMTEAGISFKPSPFSSS